MHKMSKKKLWKKIAQSWQLYLLLLVPIVWLVTFEYVPMAGLQIAFKDFSNKGGIWGSPWVGLEKFKKFFSDRQFSRLMINTLRISIYSMAVGFIVPIIMALSLNILKDGVFKKTVQTLTYIPHFLSVVVLVGMVMQLFNPVAGLYGTIYQLITGTRPSDIMGIPEAFPHLYVWSGIWQNAGWGSIIYVAALANSDQQLHEAAQIDGATRLQRVWHIDIPTILPTAVIMLIMDAGKVMSVGFEKVFLFQNDLNISYSEVLSTYVYKKSFAATIPDFSFSTAAGMFNSVINLILITIVNQISRKVSETSLW
ncbi:MAG: sugar ABC transporter permease [Lachnospiraceae bacterium]|nr:sugar ABC transporter permease [Lachnospiraceae bacterium]